MNTLLKRFGRAVGKVLPNGLFLYAKKVYYAREMRALSETDELDFAVLKYLVKPADIVADVGANIGDYTKILSDLVGKEGKVFSFEPVPTTYEILTSNIQRLKLSNVRSFNHAISSQEGRLTMEIPIHPEGKETHYLARIVEGESDGNALRVEIEARRLDSMLEAVLESVTFVKCDVEGHELSAIQSAEQLIAKSNPSWLIEFSSDPDSPDSDAAKVTRIFRDSGYLPFWYDGESLRMRKSGDSSVNYFFLTEKHILDLKDKIRLVTA